ncbi:hypothetical protein COOONC_18973 [Cooperia oncophora]
MHITCVLLLALIVGATSDAKAYFRWKRAAAMKTAAPAPKAPNPKKEVATAPKHVKAAAPKPSPKPTKGRSDAAPSPKPTKGATATHKPQQEILPLKRTAKANSLSDSFSALSIH